MDKSIKLINELLVNSFNKIIVMEKQALEEGPFSDLTIKEFHAIEAIGLHEKTMTETAVQLGITVGTLTVTVNRLVQKEYVERQEIEGDRRYVKLVLTKKGKLAWRVHESFHRHMVMSMIKDLKESEYEILIQSLEGLIEFLNKDLIPHNIEDKMKKSNKK